ncbi:unnamed protein product [Didymodactylos carnosus]|uniref:Choline/carnitine acyltransferase domain-containing protein n=1 Tax=Didymodactylos carnosus TaxID=1234261 RepID=A0A814IHH2_9BILA|nr:unnamed protein product [Didymodactylos carnosus]CAF1285451.1 unnamed protein product [Didymodactylos carnosus]CAF3794832.1 unnamed protein product [Didymodactylos carnosus]CAF4090379.1 unnamed protein product [Didymodactylos carnosus]
MCSCSLPVPKLVQTAQKYLKTVAPLLNNDEFNETKKVVDEFLQEAEPLQQLLLKRADTEINWLSQWWLDQTYLLWRGNLPIYYNPGALFPKQKYRNFDEQLKFAANFIYALLKYRKLIDNDLLPIDRAGTQMLCMDQHTKVFGTCRIPGEKIDRLCLYDKNIKNTNMYRHAALFYRNNIYRLPLYDDNNNELSPSSLYSLLNNLSNDECGQLIGHLTADERRHWAPIYKELTSDPNNDLLFDTIHNSLFVVCIDDKEIESKNYKNKNSKTLAALNFFHGGVTNTSNRWFDKTIQLIIAPNGYAGINYEHSCAEGGPIMAMIDYSLEYCQNASIPELVRTTSSYTKVPISIPKHLEQQIIDSRKRVDKLIENFDVTIVSYAEFGKQFAKLNKLSIDAIIQVGLQLAYFRMHGKPGVCYESGSLRKFHFGRTETIRSCTIEAQQFIRSMLEKHNETTQETKYQLLLNAIQAHRKYTNDAINGQGVDRHLLGLKLISIENHLPLPVLYNHFSYKRAMHFVLSTSQIASKHECVMLFGAAVNDGYGFCYNPLNDQILFMISTYKLNNNDTDAEQFSQYICSSLSAIQQLIKSNANELKSKL